MAALGTFNINGHSEMAVVLCPEHYQTCQSQGWDKKKIQEFLQKHAFRTRAELIRGGILEEEVQPEDEKTKIYAVESPDDILLVVGGGGGQAREPNGNAWIVQGGCTDSSMACTA